MTKEELAKSINNSYYNVWYMKNLEEIAKDSGLVIVLRKDSMVYFIGAISKEVDCGGDNAEVRIVELPKKIVVSSILRGIRDNRAVMQYSCETEMPNEKFTMYSGDNNSYIGIVLSAEELNLQQHEDNTLEDMFGDIDFDYENMAEHNNQEPCDMCLNARVAGDGVLNDENDFSAISIGTSKEGCSMYINSGNGEPVNIEVLQWNNKSGRNVTIARYFPKFCPNCGRKLDEYNAE